MGTFSDNRYRWKESSRMVYYGMLVLTIFGFISRVFGSFSWITAVGSLMAGLAEAMTDMSDLKEMLSGYYSLLYAFEGLTVAGWVLYLYGLNRFKIAQPTESSRHFVRNVFIAACIEVTSVIFMFFSQSLTDTLGSFWVVGSWILSIVAYSMFLSAFRGLRNEPSWNKKAKDGADTLRLWAKYNIWLLIIPVIFIVVFSITVVAGTDTMKNVAISPTSTYKTLEDTYTTFKTILILECALAGLSMVILCISQLIFNISGWYKIMTGSLDEATVNSVNGSTLFCGNCGSPLPAGSQFCPQCGTPVVQVIAEETEPDSGNYGYEDNADSEEEEAAKRKRWYIIGGVAAGVIALAVIVWAVWLRDSEQPDVEYRVEETNAVVFSEVEDGTGIGVLAELPYGTAVKAYSSDDSSEWVKVEIEKDGKTVKGFINRHNLILAEAFGKGLDSDEDDSQGGTSYNRDSEEEDFTFTPKAYGDDGGEEVPEQATSSAMAGAIDGKYNIEMDFTEFPDGTIRGTYHYVKNKIDINLSGTYTVAGDGLHDVSLEERVNGNLTGTFIGRYDGTSFHGSWISADGEKEMPFRVTK